MTIADIQQQALVHNLAALLISGNNLLCWGRLYSFRYESLSDTLRSNFSLLTLFGWWFYFACGSPHIFFAVQRLQALDWLLRRDLLSCVASNWLLLLCRLHHVFLLVFLGHHEEKTTVNKRGWLFSSQRWHRLPNTATWTHFHATDLTPMSS